MREPVNGYDCRRFKVSVEAQVRQKRKIIKKFDQTYESYFSVPQKKEEVKDAIGPEHVRMTKDEVRQVES